MILLAGPESKDKLPIQDVTWEDVEGAIRKLDGHTLTMLTFGTPQSGIPVALPYMSVSGGNGRYVVYATFDDSHFPSLTSPDNPPGLVSLVAGGQKIEVDATECVDLETVLVAAKAFFGRSELEPSLHWKT